MIVVHVTHEAVEKIGGIGAVIAGLMTADSYQNTVSRTVLLGPVLTTDQPVNRRLGEAGHVIYSTLDAITPPPWHEKFHPIESTYDVGIVYGTRKISDPYSGRCVDSEVLLVDVFHYNKPRLDLFKGELYKKFAVPSDSFEHIWEYEQYVRLAEPGFEALKAIGVNGGQEQILLLAHEYMGMPTALKATLAGSQNTRTVFYAHEVASVRPIVEKLPGHDTMFYNVIRRASADGQTLEKIFPDVLSNFKHPLVKAARYCDHVFAVGDFIEAELRMLDRHFRTTDIDIVYNGIPALPLSLEAKKDSRARMQAYAYNLLGRKPTWIFTHVCRPVMSKGLWRDTQVLHELEHLLANRGETAVFFLLGTLGGQRRPRDVRHMEKVYGWPVAHEKGYPDICGGEEGLGDMIDQFNREHSAIDAVFVNQWDWNRDVCGDRMPEEMTFSDIRQGTDLEFGLGIYEPFGISQLEPLCFGALCAGSNVCGCMGFARRAVEGRSYDNDIIEADYLAIPEPVDINELLKLSIEKRTALEIEEAKRLAGIIIERLPRTDEQLLKRIESGYDLARRMSWERVVEELFLPSLDRTLAPA